MARRTSLQVGSAGPPSGNPAEAFEREYRERAARNWRSITLVSDVRLGFGFTVAAKDDAWVISRTVPGSPAAREGGMRVGDVVVAVNELVLTSAKLLDEILASSERATIELMDPAEAPSYFWRRHNSQPEAIRGNSSQSQRESESHYVSLVSGPANPDAAIAARQATEQRQAERQRVLLSRSCGALPAGALRRLSEQPVHDESESSPVQSVGSGQWRLPSESSTHTDEENDTAAYVSIASVRGFSPSAHSPTARPRPPPRPVPDTLTLTLTTTTTTTTTANSSSTPSAAGAGAGSGGGVGVGGGAASPAVTDSPSHEYACIAPLAVTVTEAVHADSDGAPGVVRENSHRMASGARPRAPFEKQDSFAMLQEALEETLSRSTSTEQAPIPTLITLAPTPSSLLRGPPTTAAPPPPLSSSPSSSSLGAGSAPAQSSPTGFSRMSQRSGSSGQLCDEDRAIAESFLLSHRLAIPILELPPPAQVARRRAELQACGELSSIICSDSSALTEAFPSCADTPGVTATLAAIGRGTRIDIKRLTANEALYVLCTVLQDPPAFPSVVDAVLVAALGRRPGEARLLVQFIILLLPRINIDVVFLVGTIGSRIAGRIAEPVERLLVRAMAVALTETLSADHARLLTRIVFQIGPAIGRLHHAQEAARLLGQPI